MAEMKLTKAEQQLKKTNPKKFAELMKRRQTSSARKLRLSQQKQAEDAGSRETTAAGAIGAMMAVTPIGMAKAFLVPAVVGKSLVKKGAAKVASTAAAKNAGKASKALVSKLKKVKNPEKGFDPNKPFVIVKGKATNKIPPSKVSKIAKATPDKPMSRPEKIVRVAAGQGQKGRRSGTALRDPKTGKLTGVKDKDARIGKGIGDMAGPATRAAGVLAASAAAGDKKPAPKPAPKTAPKPTSTRADVKKKPPPPSVKKQEPPKVKAKVSSGGRSKGRGGIDSGLLEFIKSSGGRDAFKPDAIDRGLASLGGGEVSGPMVKAEAAYLNSLYDKEQLGLDLTKQEQSFMDNFGKKKGGRLKKKKPVSRKKAVTKKASVRKKAVAKKPVARRRGAKRGFGVALRGY